jgi:flagellar hook-basal body complex protein FliE
MIDAIAAAGAASRLSGPGETDMAGAAAMPQMPQMPSAMPAPSSGSFTEVMQSLGVGAMNNLKAAEGQSLAAVRGEAVTRDVVDAVMTAERSLQTATAIRDKLVTAYLEIARMQI